MRIAILALVALAACGNDSTSGTADGGLDVGAPTDGATDASVTTDGATATDASADGDADAGPAPGATYGGCPVFPASDYYNVDVTSAPLDPNSAAYVASVSAVSSGPFFASTNAEKVNLATKATPLLPVHPKVSWHTFPTPYPWAPGFYIEPLHPDGHAMVLDTDTCQLYEMYAASFSADAGLSAENGGQFDLAQPLPQQSVKSLSGSTASGVPFFAGMVKWDGEGSVGVVRHAINIEPTIGSLSPNQYVAPAIGPTGVAYKGPSSLSAHLLPYGAKLRLHASFQPQCGSPCPQAKMVVQALKQYGAIVSDTGSSGEAMDFANAQDGTDPWQWGIGKDLYALEQIHLTDFDVVQLPPIQ